MARLGARHPAAYRHCPALPGMVGGASRDGARMGGRGVSSAQASHVPQGSAARCRHTVAGRVAGAPAHKESGALMRHRWLAGARKGQRGKESATLSASAPTRSGSSGGGPTPGGGGANASAAPRAEEGGTDHYAVAQGGSSGRRPHAARTRDIPISAAQLLRFSK